MPAQRSLSWQQLRTAQAETLPIVFSYVPYRGLCLRMNGAPSMPIVSERMDRGRPRADLISVPIRGLWDLPLRRKSIQYAVRLPPVRHSRVLRNKRLTHARTRCNSLRLGRSNGAAGGRHSSLLSGVRRWCDDDRQPLEFVGLAFCVFPFRSAIPGQRAAASPGNGSHFRGGRRARHVCGCSDGGRQSGRQDSRDRHFHVARRGSAIPKCGRISCASVGSAGGTGAGTKQNRDPGYWTVSSPRNVDGFGLGALPRVKITVAITMSREPVK